MWDTPRLWLLPWIALMAMVAAIPLFVWPAAARRSMFSPVAFAAWFHIVPSFVLGGLVLAAGFTPVFYSRIPVPEETLPWAIALVAIGFLSLFAGYAWEGGARLGALAGRVLPDPHWPMTRLAPVSLVLWFAAAGVNGWAFRQGWIGFQSPEAPSSAMAAGVILASALAVTVVVLLFQVVLSRDPGARRWRVPAILGLVAWVTLDTLASGRRGALFQSVVLGTGVWLLADGPRPTARRGLTVAGLAAGAIVIGMIYGTTLRQVLGSETRVTPDRYAAAAADAVEIVAGRGVTANLAYAAAHFAERLEIVSSVGLIIGNYQRLRPFEEAYGLEDNIRTSLLSALVPRVVWPDKPSVSDPRALGELYFNYRNSFAVTPAADLVRNFGPWSVPVGMALLGMLLRAGYAALIEDRPPSAMRTTAYVVLLTTVSYEGFYGAILPSVLRTGAVLAVVLTGVHVAVRLWSRRQVPPHLERGEEAAEDQRERQSGL